MENLFSLKNIKVKDLILENANFNLTDQNFKFFIDLLDNNFIDGNLIIKNSKIFFKNLQDDVLFINKILNMKYYYDANELENFLYAKNEIFNIPYEIQLGNKKDQKKIISKVNLNFINMKVENELSYKNEIKEGVSNLIHNKLKSKIIYKIKKNLFEFNFFDKQDDPKFNFRGEFNFKPFYAILDGKSKDLNLSYLFGQNAIIAELLKTELFNNKNIDFKLNINTENIKATTDFKNLKINSKIQEGLIDIDHTNFKWKDVVEFKIIDSLIFVKDGELILDGKLQIKIKDYNEIYKYLLTPKNYRNKINQIDISFTYNFDQKVSNLKDIKIDNIINSDVNKILNNLILKEDNLQNKIYLKNLLNQAIKSYSG